jgi:hypothetical protein
MPRAIEGWPAPRTLLGAVRSRSPLDLAMLSTVPVIWNEAK